MVSLDGDLSMMKKKKKAEGEELEDFSAPSFQPVIPMVQEDAKSSVGILHLPTGYLDDEGKLHTEVELREMCGEEEDILTNRKIAVHVRLNKLLENCVLAVGPYKQKDLRWPTLIKDLVASDRLFLILQLRVLSLGPKFSAKMKCAECGHLSNQTVNLNDFKIGAIKDPMSRTWKGVLPKSQLTYIAKSQTGHEEAKLAPHSESKDLMSLAMLGRLVELDGKPVTLSMIKEMSWADRQHLRKEFAEREGDMDRSMEYECQECGHENKEEVDIGSPNFFFPSETSES